MTPYTIYCVLLRYSNVLRYFNVFSDALYVQFDVYCFFFQFSICRMQNSSGYSMTGQNRACRLCDSSTSTLSLFDTVWHSVALRQRKAMFDQHIWMVVVVVVRFSGFESSEVFANGFLVSKSIEPERFEGNPSVQNHRSHFRKVKNIWPKLFPALCKLMFCTEILRADLPNYCGYGPVKIDVWEICWNFELRNKCKWAICRYIEDISFSIFNLIISFGKLLMACLQSQCGACCWKVEPFCFIKIAIIININLMKRFCRNMTKCRRQIKFKWKYLFHFGYIWWKFWITVKCFRSY